jgi:hypothetical protein
MHKSEILSSRYIFGNTLKMGMAADDFFRSRLERMIDLTHQLAVLVHLT